MVLPQWSWSHPSLRRKTIAMWFCQMSGAVSMQAIVQHGHE